MSIHRKGKTFPCPNCDYEAKVKGGLQRHIESIHDGKVFLCPDCDYKAKYKTNLQRHIKSIHDGEVISCPDCESKFVQRSTLNRHIKVFHNNSEEKETFHCTMPNCEYETPWKNGLKIHIESVHEGLTNQCPNCKYKTVSKGNLQRHIKSAHEEVISCSYCEYETASTRKKQLYIHIRSVHGEQMFPCPYCGYKATRKSSIQIHIRSVHRGQKFPCPQCDYKAKQKANVQQHIKFVHEGITHQCPHCKFKSAWKHYFMTHVKSNHKGEKLDVPDPDTEPQSTTGEDDFISDDEESPLSDKSTDDIKTEGTMQTEQEYFEPDIKIEKLPAAGNDDFNISDDEEDQRKEGDEAATGQRYLCPISSCTFSHSVRDGDNQQERAHFVTSHSDVQNIDNLHFIRL